MSNTINRERPLSALQVAILDVLPPYGEGSIMAGAVLDALRDGAGKPSTNGDRAALSRALARLEQRGLVYRLVTEVCLMGNGYRWARVDPDAPPPEPMPADYVRFKIGGGKRRSGPSPKVVGSGKV